MLRMAKDPTKTKAFKNTLANLLKAPPKPHAEMKIGPGKKRKKKAPPKRG
jgi:hypothetical protein